MKGIYLIALVCAVAPLRICTHYNKSLKEQCFDAILYNYQNLSTEDLTRLPFDLQEGLLLKLVQNHVLSNNAEKNKIFRELFENLRKKCMIVDSVHEKKIELYLNTCDAVPKMRTYCDSHKQIRRGLSSYLQEQLSSLRVFYLDGLRLACFKAYMYLFNTDYTALFLRCGSHGQPITSLMEETLYYDKYIFIGTSAGSMYFFSAREQLQNEVKGDIQNFVIYNRFPIKVAARYMNNNSTRACIIQADFLSDHISFTNSNLIQLPDHDIDKIAFDDTGRLMTTHTNGDKKKWSWDGSRLQETID